MFLNSLKSSFRNLTKSKAVSILGIIGFAVGFSVCIIIGLYIFNEMTMDNFNTNKEKIYRLVNAKNNSCDFDYLLTEKLSSAYPGIQRSCPVEISPHQTKVNHDQNITLVDGLISTTNDFFNLFTIQVLESLSSDPFTDENSAIITKSAAEKLFGKESPLGKPINVLGVESIISAVIEDFPHNSSIQGNILRNSENKNFRMSISAYVNPENGEFTLTNLTNHYLLLGANQIPGHVEDYFNSSLKSYEPNIDSVFLQPLKNIYLNTTIPDKNLHGNRIFIKIISFVGILILLLSIVNYINYILSYRLKKQKELGIQKTIGARRFHLIMYFLVEILLWIFFSIALSMGIVSIVIPLFNKAFDLHLQFGVLFRAPFLLGGILSILVFTGLSIIPYIFLLTRFQTVKFLRGNAGQKNNNYASNVLTVFQLTISIVLISGLLIIQKQIIQVKQTNLGFNTKKLLNIELPTYKEGYETFKEELLKNPAIQKATLSAGIPGQISSKMLHPDWDFICYNLTVDENFISTMGMEIIDGRDFTSHDKERKSYILNESALAVFESIDSAYHTMAGIEERVGVVKDFNFESLHQSIQPLIMQYGSGRNMSLRISTKNVADVMNYINKAWDEHFANEPMQYKFYDTWFDSMYKSDEQVGHISGIFSLIAIIITCLGLLGKIIQTATNRTKEIGIRKVNGAKVNEILTMLNRDVVKWVVIAFVIACPIAYYAMHKWLENFAYKTTLSWWIFALAGLMALGIALLTVSWQSWRAARRNPVEALRYE